MLVDGVNGFSMIISSQDRGIGNELLYSHIHEPLATKLLPCMVKPGNIVLECGANIGYYTLLLSRLVGENGKVISVEPNPEVTKLLRINTELNTANNVDIYQAALGDKEEEVDFYIRGASNLSSMTAEDGEYVAGQKVQMMMADTMIKQLDLPSIDLIRMDVEGYEVEILEGASNIIQRHFPRFLIEYHKEKIGISRAEDALMNMDDMGYNIKFAFSRDGDWPWLKQASIYASTSIPDFLKSDLWKSKHMRTYTLMLEASNRDNSNR